MSFCALGVSESFGYRCAYVRNVVSTTSQRCASRARRPFCMSAVRDTLLAGKRAANRSTAAKSESWAATSRGFLASAESNATIALRPARSAIAPVESLGYPYAVREYSVPARAKSPVLNNASAKYVFTACALSDFGNSRRYRSYSEAAAEYF